MIIGPRHRCRVYINNCRLRGSFHKGHSDQLRQANRPVGRITKGDLPNRAINMALENERRHDRRARKSSKKRCTGTCPVKKSCKPPMTEKPMPRKSPTKNSARRNSGLETEEDAQKPQEPSLMKGADFAELGEEKIHGSLRPCRRTRWDGFRARMKLCPRLKPLSPSLKSVLVIRTG